MRASTFFSCWLPPILWSGLIFYFSSIPSLNSGLGLWDFIFRKIAHMVEFGVLALLWLRALAQTWKSLAPTGLAAVAGVLSLLYAISDEVHQSFVPGRGPSAGDVAIDAIGIFVALWIVRKARSRKSEAVFATAKKLGMLIAISVLSGCGPEAEMKSARSAEARGKPYVAWQKYQTFAARRPDHKNAPEAMFRAGWLAQTVLKDCDASRAFYERVAQKYPASEPWAALAGFHSQNCPDYFPLTAKSLWVEGDSDTRGKNARIESLCLASSTPARIPFSAATISRTYFAGESKFKSVDVFYRKDGATVWEHPSKGEAPRILLKAPLALGTRWTSQVGGRAFSYEVVSTSATVEVGAGTFEKCLHVRAKSEGTPGAANEYYAPSVGRVLTSFSTEAGEKRNIELLSFTAGPMELPQP